ncbi:MAG: hypothetical protein WAT39_00200 [Planctomycetota bacterium]
MDHPDLADPGFEPTDEQLAQLMQRAFAGVSERHQEVLRAMHQRIAEQGREIRRRWQESKSCNRS